MREFAKVVGGVDEESGTKVYDIYKKFITNLHVVSSARAAEFIKLMEGCYRDVNIALANELFKISGELGINFYEAREYANHEYCHLHMPSTGVGGHCIPVYPWFLIKYMEKRGKFSYTELLRTSREINDQMVEYWAEKIILDCLKVNKPLGDVKICIKGITFRQGVKQLYHSRNLALVNLLMEKGLNVSVYDELFSEEELEKMGLSEISPDEADLIFDSSELMMEIS